MREHQHHQPDGDRPDYFSRSKATVLLRLTWSQEDIAIICWWAMQNLRLPKGLGRRVMYLHVEGNLTLLRKKRRDSFLPCMQ